MGFDFRWLLKIVGERFLISGITPSPFRGLPWYFNSQIFIVASPLR
jgi:hypothetical protein